MTNYDVVKKLIGRVEPIGESNEDSKRLINLEELIYVTECLIRNLKSVAEYNSSYESSVKYAGLTSSKYLNGLKDDLIEFTNQNNLE
jgi:hypothetical protein